MTYKLPMGSLLVSPSLSVSGCLFQSNHDSGPVAIDQFLLGDGTSNTTGLGGYWFTEADRSMTTSIEPNTGKVDPLEPGKTELRPGLWMGNGLEDDGSGNAAFHVTGTVGAAPVDPTAASFSDKYWDLEYAQLCVDGNCREVIRPAAHLGVGFRAQNRILTEYDTLTQGIVFRAKAGKNHDGFAQGDPRPIRVTAPMDLTDVPDPSFGDQFGTEFSEGADPGLLAISENRNVPFCSFVGSKRLDGSGAVGAEDKTCFCHFQSPEVPLSSEWKTFCIPWTAFKDPGCSGLAKATYPEGGITKLIPERLIKILFDTYRPQGTEPATDFDLWIDDVRMLGPSKSQSMAPWDKYCGETSGATVL